MRRIAFTATVAWVTVPILAAIGFGILSATDWRAIATDVLQTVAVLGLIAGGFVLIVVVIGVFSGELP